MRIISAILLLFMVISGLVYSSYSAQSDRIRPFTSDGCSAFPDGTLSQQNLWLACCTAHDKAYWKGGTYEERLAADVALQQCVANVGEPDIANLMLAGVRVGGSPYLPANFRWGYGWKYPKPYRSLSNSELTQILLSELGLSRQKNFQHSLSSGEMIPVNYIAIKSLKEKQEYTKELNLFADGFKKPGINNPIIASEYNLHFKKGVVFSYYVDIEQLFANQKFHLDNAKLIWNTLKKVVENNQLRFVQIEAVGFTERASDSQANKVYATLVNEFRKNDQGKWLRNIKMH